MTFRPSQYDLIQRVFDDTLRARLALIVGDNELLSGKLILRDLTTRQQSEVTLDELEARVRQAMD